MNKRRIVVVLLAVCSAAVCADELHYEVGYTHVAIDSVSSLDLGAVYGTVGYEFADSGNLAHELEGSVLLGVSDDSVGSTTLDLEPSVEAAYRATYQSTNDDLRYFFRVTYTRVELEGSSAFVSGSVTDSESGGGLGVGIEWRGVTFGVTRYFNDLEDFSRINIGYRFK